jgi:hypothetical protein
MGGFFFLQMSELYLKIALSLCSFFLACKIHLQIHLRQKVVASADQSHRQQLSRVSFPPSDAAAFRLAFQASEPAHPPESRAQ